jgi:hypothetical protein
MNRKKFFASLGKGSVGLFLMSTFPFNLFGKNKQTESVKVEINPLAVSRKKIGDKHV